MKVIILTTSLVLCSVDYVATAKADETCARETNPTAKAACVKADHEKRAADKENIKLTGQLLARGDLFYKKGKYYQASHAYDLANFYIPSPYAYLREAESLFPAYAGATGFEDEAGKSTGQCLLPARFIDMTDDTLQRYYKVGVAFAKIHHFGPVISSTSLAEAEQRIGCLEGGRPNIGLQRGG